MRNKLTLEDVFFGKEPQWNENDTIDLNSALSWYSNQFGTKESKDYTLEYVKKYNYPKDTIEKLSKIKDSSFKNLGFLCRIIIRGANLNKTNHINEKINEILNCPEEVKEKQESTIRSAIFDQTTIYINVIEDIIENIYKTKIIPDFNFYDYLTSNNIKPLYTKYIINYYSSLKTEIELTLNKQDPQLIEGYSLWNKKSLSKFYSFICEIIKCCEDYYNNKKTTRKRTKKKPINLEKKIAKLVYKKEDNDYKIVSINPIDIISCQQLYVFNTKTKKFGIYYAKDQSGLSIKGTTIENFEETVSLQKTIRKPLDVLNKIISAKKTEIKKLFKDISSKESILTGRINSDTILLKIIKK